MKLRGSGPVVTVGAVISASSRDVRLRALVDQHCEFVARVLRRAGTPEAELDDDVQRTFIAISRRLDDVRPESERSFLFQTALRMAAHARRTLARRREVQDDSSQQRQDLGAQPEQLLSQKRDRQLLDLVLSQMDKELRTVFVLYELEELRVPEIALTLQIPEGTVASRLRRARAELRQRLRAHPTQRLSTAAAHKGYN